MERISIFVQARWLHLSVKGKNNPDRKTCTLSGHYRGRKEGICGMRELNCKTPCGALTRTSEHAAKMNITTSHSFRSILIRSTMQAHDTISKLVYQVFPRQFLSIHYNNSLIKLYLCQEGLFYHASNATYGISVPLSWLVRVFRRIL